MSFSLAATRRRFIELLGAAAATASPLAGRAQPPAMPAATVPIAANPDNPANGLDPILQQAQALGAPMAAVARAVAISRQSMFPKKDALAVFDISQPSANKRFYLLDFKSGEATAHYAAHGRANGPNAKAVKFKGFQKDLDMVPLGPLKTAHSEVMNHYKTIVDRYDGTVYPNMIVVVLEGVTAYNSYINHTRHLNGFCIRTGTRLLLIARKITACSAGATAASPSIRSRITSWCGGLRMERWCT
jgi:hypothetical protein